MPTEVRKARDQPKLVSSLITALISAAGPIESVCIKFAMFDGTTRLSYWEPKWFLALYECVEYYSGMHYHGSDLQRSVDEPSFIASLPKRHPVRTLNDERPNLSAEEYQAARECFSVTALKVIDDGGICSIECTYHNGDRRTELLPAYIAMHLCGSLKASFQLSDLMSAEPGGSA